MLGTRSEIYLLVFIFKLLGASTRFCTICMQTRKPHLGLSTTQEQHVQRGDLTQFAYLLIHGAVQGAPQPRVPGFFSWSRIDPVAESSTRQQSRIRSLRSFLPLLALLLFGWHRGQRTDHENIWNIQTQRFQANPPPSSMPPPISFTRLPPVARIGPRNSSPLWTAAGA